MGGPCQDLRRAGLKDVAFLWFGAPRRPRLEPISVPIGTKVLHTYRSVHYGAADLRERDALSDG